MRLFLSFNPGLAEIDQLIERQTRLRHAMESRTPTLADMVRWTRSNQFHLTMEFLGDLKRDALNSISPLIAETAKQVKAGAVIIDGIGSFPVYRAPQVLWLRVRQGDGLMALQRRLRVQLTEAGMKFEAGYFPHITIGRLKKTRAPAMEVDAFCALVDQMTDELQNDPVSWPAKQLSLMQSRPATGGPEYRCLESYPVGDVEA